MAISRRRVLTALLVAAVIIAVLLLHAGAALAAWEWSVVGVGSIPWGIQAMAQDGTYLYAGSGTGTVYQMPLSGGSWTQTGTNSLGSQICSLLYDDTHNILYAGVWSNKVYQNDLTGGAWTQTGSNTLGPVVNTLAYDGTRLYAGCDDWRVYQNDLAGGAWTQTGSNSLGSAVNSLAYTGGRLYAGCHSGTVYENTLAGGAWTQAGSNTPGWPVESLAFDGTHLFAGCGNGWVHQMPLAGGSWSQTGSNQPSSEVAALVRHGSELYAACLNGVIYQNALAGGAWTQTGSDTAGDDFIRCMVYAGTHLYVGCSNGVAYANALDGGAWVEEGSDVPGSTIQAIAIDPTRVFVGCANDIVYQHDLSGGTWSQTGSNTPGWGVDSLAYNGTYLYAGCLDGNVYRNALDGGPWTQEGAVQPGSHISALVYVGGSLYAGCEDSVVYRNMLVGDDWVPAGSNSPGSDVMCLVTDGTHLFAGCDNGTVYQYALSGGAWTQAGSNSPGSFVWSLTYDGTNLYAGCDNGTVYQNALAGGTWAPTGSTVPGASVRAVAHHGGSVFAGCIDGTVYYNNLAGGAWAQAGTNKPGTAHALSCSSTELFAGCTDGNLYRIGLLSPSTGPATAIGAYAATLEGEIVSTGGEIADERGFRYREQGTGTWTGWTETGSYGAGAYDRPVAELNPGTTYEYQAIAHNLSGWAYGDTETFTTYQFPAVDTDPATSVGPTGATLNGDLTSTGDENPDQRGFHYREQGSGDPWAEWTESGSFGTGTYSYALSGLDEGVAYEYQAMAHNQAGWAYGDTETFTTIGFPSLTTDPATSVGPGGATLHGDVTSTGGENPDQRGFRYQQKGTGTWADWTEGGSFGTGVYSHPLTGLPMGTTYEYQAMAHNSAGWAYGDTEEFTTLDVPALTTNPATAVGAAGATLKGTITSTGGEDASERGFIYRVQGTGTWTVWNETGTFGTGDFSHPVTGLAPGTTYEYRASARNSAGWQYGSQLDFTTVGLPALTTYPATDVGTTGATLEGEMTSTGGESADERGFRYREQGTGTWTEWSETGSYGTGAYDRPVAGLDPGITYEYEAMAHNSAGWAYGDTEQFTTGVEALSTWYLAEGSNAWGFTTYVSIENPGDSELHARLTFVDTAQPASGGKHAATRTVTLPALSQTTVSSVEDIGAVDFSTKVECLEGRDIAVDRTMCWTGEGAPCQEGHASVGVTAPAGNWYMPEGSSKWGFETWTCVLNPNAAEASVTLTYMTEEDGAKVVQKKVSPNSRSSFSMLSDIGEHDSSIQVTSDIPVIAERSMYRDNRREGTCSVGASAPAGDFYLAEGTTNWGFTTYVLVQNPNRSQATVTLTYMTPSGPVQQAPFAMPADSRKTVRVNDVPGVESTDLSTHVHADRPIIAERAMYWNGGPDNAQVGHASIGVASPHLSFYLPDGETTNGWETWATVANPNTAEVRVEVEYLPAGGGRTVTFTEVIPAGSRRTYNMAGAPGSYPGIQGRGSILVRSLNAIRPILVERPMYCYDRGLGTDTIGGFSD